MVGRLKIGSTQPELDFFVLTKRGPIIFAGSFGMKPCFRLWNEAGSHADWAMRSMRRKHDKVVISIESLALRRDRSETSDNEMIRLGAKVDLSK